MSDDINMTEEVDELQNAVDAACALIDRLQEKNKRLRAENERLRELVEGMEEELKEAGAVSWRTPDDKAVDADLLREDAHERKRLEKEYPWKE